MVVQYTWFEIDGNLSWGGQRDGDHDKHVTVRQAPFGTNVLCTISPPHWPSQLCFYYKNKKQRFKITIHSFLDFG